MFLKTPFQYFYFSNVLKSWVILGYKVLQGRGVFMPNLGRDGKEP